MGELRLVQNHAGILHARIIANCNRIHILAPWSPKAWRIFRRAGARRARAHAFTDVVRRSAGVLWRTVDYSRPVHPAGSVSAMRRDGGGILQAARGQGTLANREWR